MPVLRYDPYIIAGASRDGTLPAGLNTAIPATDLRADETPDGYGFDLTKEGRIAVGSIASGTARIAKTVTISDTTYYWFYNRLWRMVTDATTPFAHYLWFGAPNIDAQAMEQGLSKIVLNHNGAASGPIAICPFGGDNLAVGLASGSYIIGNCSDSRAFFQRSDIIQELACPAATQMIELDGVLYVSNGNGLVAYADGASKEITAPLRNSLTGFTNLALTVDYTAHRVIAGTALVFDAPTGKLFKYISTSFRFTTREFHAPDYRPMAIDRLVFVIEHGDTTDGYIDYEVRSDDGTWSDTYRVQVPYMEERYTVVTEGLEYVRSCRRFQVRISGMTSTKYIKEIRCDASAFNFDGYSV